MTGHESLERDVAVLKRIVIEGNGEPSLVARVTSLEVPVRIMCWLGGATFVAVLGIAATLLTGRLR